MCGSRSFSLQEAGGPQGSCLPFLAAWEESGKDMLLTAGRSLR